MRHVVAIALSLAATESDLRYCLVASKDVAALRKFKLKQYYDFAFCNFITHSMLRVSPAMAAGAADHL
jgi:hypothetical protein